MYSYFFAQKANGKTWSSLYELFNIHLFIRFALNVNESFAPFLCKTTTLQSCLHLPALFKTASRCVLAPREAQNGPTLMESHTWIRQSQRLKFTSWKRCRSGSVKQNQLIWQFEHDRFPCRRKMSDTSGSNHFKMTADKTPKNLFGCSNFFKPYTFTLFCLLCGIFMRFYQPYVHAVGSSSNWGLRLSYVQLFQMQLSKL